MTPTLLIGAAEYLGSTLDLGNATHEELTEMLLTAVAQGYGMEWE